MPFNASGFLVVFQVLVQPRVIVPSLVIKGVQQKLYKFCLTDTYPKISGSWISMPYAKLGIKEQSSTKIIVWSVNQRLYSISRSLTLGPDRAS